MFNKKIAILGFLVSGFLLSCYSFTEHGRNWHEGEEKYKSGNYPKAVMYAVKSLKAKGTYEKAQNLLKKSFPKAVEQYLTDINSFESSSEKFKYDGIVKTYNKLIAMQDMVQSLNKSYPNVEIVDYSEKLKKAKKKAAESHYLEGIKLAKINDLDSQKAAAKEFKKAQSFVSGYKDADSRYAACQKAGTKRIAIMPFENISGKTQFGEIGKIIADNLITEIMNASGAMEFLEIITRNQLSVLMKEHKLNTSGIVDTKQVAEFGKVASIHEIITGKISQITITPVSRNRQKFQKQKRVVVGQRKVRDSKGRVRSEDVKRTVSVKFTIYTKKASVTVRATYQIIDVKTGKLKKTDSISEKYEWENKWATYNGDERALDPEIPDLSKKTEEQVPPTAELFNKAFEEVTKSLSSTIINYVK